MTPPNNRIGEFYGRPTVATATAPPAPEIHLEAILILAPQLKDLRRRESLRLKRDPENWHKYQSIKKDFERSVGWHASDARLRSDQAYTVAWQYVFQSKGGA